MGKLNKLLSNMRRNPRDWRIEELITLAKRFGVEYRQPGTSHVTFRAPDGQRVTVPSHKPIKPIYIKQFINMLDDLGVEK